MAGIRNQQGSCHPCVGASLVERGVYDRNLSRCLGIGEEEFLGQTDATFAAYRVGDNEPFLAGPGFCCRPGFAPGTNAGHAIFIEVEKGGGTNRRGTFPAHSLIFVTWCFGELRDVHKR